VETVIRQEFTREFAGIAADEFIKEFIVRFLHPALVVSGFSHAFGRGGQGNTDMLRRLGRDLGFGVEVVPPVMKRKEKVNSTTIRHYIKDGNLKRAHAMLGRCFRLEGTVIKGKGRGRQLDMPTANILPDSESKLIPGDGVYTGLVYRKGEQYPCLVYCGSRPTFDPDGEKHVETHLLEVGESLYGETVTVEFLEKLRDDRTFGSAEELAAQMARDKTAAQAFFTRSQSSAG
jgi:riboflavin kinase/FMN adenylyltransferase